MSKSLKELLDRLNTFESPHSTCFLCGIDLLNKNYTNEHVIPRWAQQRYHLWDQKLTLLNNTDISYRYLTVPCCEDCNKYRLKPIEDLISNVVESDRESVINLGKDVIFIWLGKIFYGILYKELMLLLDRANQDMGTIVSGELISRYDSHRFFLQQAKQTVELQDFLPGSIFIFSMQEMPNRSLEWDLCDNIETMFFALRVGKIGFISILADGGAQQSYEENYSNFADLDLHPIQFRELSAQFCYRSTLATRTPKLITAESNPHKVFQLPLGGLSLKPLFDEWIPHDYAKYLAYYLDVQIEDIFEPPDKVRTWLTSPNGNKIFMNIKNHPL
jgi:hypothetical protein